MTFDDVHPNPMSVEKKDKDVFYAVYLNGVAEGIRLSKLLKIAEYIGVKNPEQLKGKSFKTQFEYPAEALDYLSWEAKTEGKYKPPTPDQLVDKLVAGIVQIEKAEKCPDVSEYADKNTIRKGLYSLFSSECENMTAAQVKSFQERVTKTSKGRLNANISPSKEIEGIDFPCKGEFFTLNRGKKVIAKFKLAATFNGFTCTTNPDLRHKLPPPPPSPGK